MDVEFSKVYEPEKIEKQANEIWFSGRHFHAEPIADGEEAKAYAIVIPPPNVTAPLHVGHALNNTLQDILIRFRRMQQFRTLWMPGTDHAGIATQTVVDKRLQAEGQLALKDYKKLDDEGLNGREEFISKVQAWKDEYEATIIEQLRAMGCSCDWDRTRFTMDETCAKAVRENFFRLFRDGLIYRGKRLVNWDPATQTVLADDEVEHETVQGHFWYLQYPLAEQVEIDCGTAFQAVCPTDVSSVYISGDEVRKRKGAYLPHLTQTGATYAVTFRLADALPTKILQLWREQRSQILRRAQEQGRELTEHERRELAQLYSDRVESHLDAGHGQCHLTDPRVAELTQNALMHFDGDRYDLIAWAVMPNHVHAVFQPRHPNTLTDILHSWKSYTATKANKLLKLTGAFWQTEYYDHLIRDEDDFRNQVDYVLKNPEKAGLEQWPWVGVKMENVPTSHGQDGHGTHGQDARATITHVTVATTRPETMLGDTAIAMNPRDPRAEALVGKMVRLPIVGRMIPIIADEHVVLPNSNEHGQDARATDEKAKFSTGFLKVTPAHDPDDWEIGQRHDLPVINVMAPDASISDKHGWEDATEPEAQNLLGMDRFEAREAIVEWFRTENLLEEVREYTHEIGHSYRSHVPIEPYLSDQWYIAVKKPIKWHGLPAREDTAKMAVPQDLIDGTDVPVNSLAGLALKPLLDGRLKFIPERYAKTYQTWLENLRDWPISRQLWWGHRIPVWTITLKRVTPYEDDIKQKRIKKDKFDPAFDTFLELCGVREYVHYYQSERAIESRYPIYVCAKSKRAANALDLLTKILSPERHHPSVGMRERAKYGDENDQFKKEFGEKAFNQIGELRSPISSIEHDPDVLDTWFSSALWPFSTMGWPDDTAELGTFYPGDVLCTAREIITLWVSRMVMMGQYCVGDIPFRDVYIHAMIQDGQGRKMSKSLGNGIDPLVAIDSHGADAMRFTLASMTTDTQDIRMPVEEMTLPDGRKANTSPKFDIGRNFCNKLWNASRFAMMNLEGLDPSQFDKDKMTVEDKWILSRLAETIAEVTESLDSFKFSEPMMSLYRFFWNDFCDWYLEWAKFRMQDEAQKPITQNILAFVLDQTLRLLHPFIPFITEGIFQRLNQMAPARGLAGIAEAKSSDALVAAQWPERIDLLTDADAEKEIEIVQVVIRTIRDIRNDRNIPPKERLVVSVKSGSEYVDILGRNAQLVEHLAGVTEFSAGVEIEKPANAAIGLADAIEVYVHNAIDPEAERQKLEKERDKTKKAKAAVEAKLRNENFVNKAKPEVVAQARDKLDELSKQLETIEKHLEELDK